MKRNIFILSTMTMSILLGLSACGGSDSTTSGQSTSSISGPITAFGSIFVNSKEYQTSNASIIIEGNPASEADLRVGMMVTVNKSADNQVLSVYSGDEVEGFVTTGIPGGATTGVLDVMGQTITVDSNTIFESKVSTITDAGKIKAGNIVEVNGYSNGTGQITATRLEVKAEAYIPNMELEVTGIVTLHDNTASTFKIGNLEILYKNAILDDLPNGITDNLYVEVKSNKELNASNQLVASKVEQEHDNHHGTEYEVKGLITGISDAAITVNNKTFVIDNSTVFIRADPTMFVVGTLVEVEGRLNANNDLVAKKIEIEDYHSNSLKAEFRANVASISVTDANTGTIILTDVNNSVLKVNNSTIMKDSSPAKNRVFNMQNIASGDDLEVKAVNNGDTPTTYTVLKLERH